jgi:cellobiose-specific phosphotransferase system component IIC
MRSGFAAAFMGIGGIFLCFSVVVFVIEIFARRSDAGHQLATMSALAVATFVGGVILFGLGYVLNRIGRSIRNGALTADR